MPLYFAYGSNMNVEAMRFRCPASRPLGHARLMRHRLFIMRDGYASVRPWPGAEVHGLLWDLAFKDIPALDRYEGVQEGLYVKAQQRVLREHGSVRALVYVGHTVEDGAPQPGYMEDVLASAEALGVPKTYLRALAAMLPAKTLGRQR
jgi:hypothetical protein